jgi:hypothetical protein
MHREELLRIADGWDTMQLIVYINELKKRVTDTQSLIKELQVIKRRKSRSKTDSFDNGVRGGM